MNASDSALSTTEVLVSGSSQPNVTDDATRALSRPIPASAHSRGVKIDEIIATYRSIGLFFSPSLAPPAVPGPEVILPSSANTSGTSLPLCETHRLSAAVRRLSWREDSRRRVVLVVESRP